MPYELWGLHPSNLIDTFKTEADALDEVRGLLDAGWSSEDLSLGRVDGTSGSLVAEGAALAQLARQANPDRKSRSV
jgi:hypothetical protein